MRTLSYTFTAGEVKPINTFAKYFRILSGSNLTVEYFNNRGAKMGEISVGVGAGYWTRYSEPFSRIDITSPTAQTIQIAMTNDQGGYDPNTVTVQNNGNVIDSQNSVSNAASTQLKAANPNRRFLMVQNNDSSAVLRLTLMPGAGISPSFGFRLQPNAVFTLDAFANTGPVNAQYETAPTITVNNVMVSEG